MLTYYSTETGNKTEGTITRRPLLQKSKSIDVSSILPRPLKMVTPAPFKRSTTIDGSNCNPIPKPATRRMRTIQINEEGCCKGDFVYVGPNPVIKKTTNMLRRPYNSPTKKKTTSVVSKKRQQQQQQQKKLTAKSASKTDLKQCRSTRVGRSRRSSLTGNSSCGNKNSVETPRAPRRKKSNPFLRGGLVGQSSSEAASSTMIQPNRSSSLSRSLSPMMTTRSQSQYQYQQQQRNPFLRGGLIGQSSSPIMTRSRSRQRLQASLSLGAPRVPSRKASVDDMHMEYTSTTSSSSSFAVGAPPRVPSRKESVDDIHIGMVYPTTAAAATTNTAPSMPHRKASNPFLNHGLVVHGPLGNEQRIIITRSRSRQKLQCDRICTVPSRKESIPDFQWDKLSLSDNTTRSKKCSSPIFPMRKASAMELDGVTA